MSKTKALTKPSVIKKKMLTEWEDDIVKGLSDVEGITKENAKRLLSSNQEWADLKAKKLIEIEMGMIQDVLPKIRKALERKLETGSLQQAQKGMTAWAIARDKLFGDNKPQMNIGGKNVNINFDFKPYKRKK